MSPVPPSPSLFLPHSLSADVVYPAAKQNVRTSAKIHNSRPLCILTHDEYRCRTCTSHTRMHLCNILHFLHILSCIEKAQYFTCVFLGVGRKKLLFFLITMTTSKQGSGLDTALPAGFLPCNVQHTHAHKHTNNKLFTNKAELWQAAGKEKAAMLQWVLLLLLSLMFFHFVWQTSLHSVSVSPSLSLI